MSLKKGEKTMNYQQQIKNLLAESREGIRYRRMSQGTRVLTIIAMLPIYAAACVAIAFYYVNLFFYNALLSPVSYLESWLEERQDKVQHATQAVLYFVCIPFIFFNRVLMSLMSFSFYFQWFLLQVIIYLATLGGIKWQPSINEASFKKRSYEFKPGEVGTMVFTILAFGAFALYVLLLLIVNVGEVWEIYEFCNVVGWLYSAMVLIVNPILFRKKEIVEAEAEAYEATEEAEASTVL